MKPGKYFKDFHYTTFVEIYKVDGNSLYGRSYYGKYLPFENQFLTEALDLADKKWLEPMHKWEIFSQSQYERALRKDADPDGLLHNDRSNGRQNLRLQRMRVPPKTR